MNNEIINIGSPHYGELTEEQENELDKKLSEIFDKEIKREK